MVSTSLIPLIQTSTTSSSMRCFHRRDSVISDINRLVFLFWKSRSLHVSATHLSYTYLSKQSIPLLTPYKMGRFNLSHRGHTETFLNLTLSYTTHREPLQEVFSSLKPWEFQIQIKGLGFITRTGKPDRNRPDFALFGLTSVQPKQSRIVKVYIQIEQPVLSEILKLETLVDSLLSPPSASSRIHSETESTRNRSYPIRNRTVSIHGANG
ncbi:unnamed protein product [Brassica rapa]|uniref:Uncharacterized protein n=1 Tax=Brassica campestris TaxID=3711 RepID=A0A8D9G5V1_BRACM|nr:unnamed protein product [Brassica rapa]